ncbi:hypothetical protein Goshw_019162 [Gossypium schwendimanii]|uniref:Ribulose bisphosphate carboxylase large subunit C-terminal domain-containing protein n=1 Tax=Gossypium schwendimanii TaxID=34291 RepID=A0A7J9MNS7_GOSSC|nr:hypothetical protein [Gossypium schwendimanii]
MGIGVGPSSKSSASLILMIEVVVFVRSFKGYSRLAYAPALTKIFGDDSVLQFNGGTLRHPWGNAPGAVANRIALDNERRDLAR